MVIVGKCTPDKLVQHNYIVARSLILTLPKKIKKQRLHRVQPLFFKIFFVTEIFLDAPTANNSQHLLGYAVGSQCDRTDSALVDCLQAHAYIAVKIPIALPFALLLAKVAEQRRAAAIEDVLLS